MFGMLVIAYLFLGGVASGTFFVMSAWSLFFHRKSVKHGYRMRRAFKALLARAYTVAFILLIMSVLCLILDLELPQRALLILQRPHATLLTFGTFALIAQFVVGLLLIIANLLELQIMGGRTRKVLEVLCLLCSISVMVYTGLFLSANTSVPFWNTDWLAVLFFFSAISTGVSLVLLIDYFTQGQTILLRAAKPLQKSHLICLILEGLSLAFFLHAGFTNPAADKSIAILMSPDMLATGTLGVVGFGIVLPFILEGYSLLRKECRAIPFSDVVCLIGGFCLRYCIIMCGVH